MKVHYDSTTDPITEQEMTPREPDPRTMEREDLRAYLRAHHVVSKWPFCGRALNLSRSSTFACRDIPTLRLGHLLKVRSSWLEQTLFGEE